MTKRGEVDARSKIAGISCYSEIKVARFDALRSTYSRLILGFPRIFSASTRLGDFPLFRLRLSSNDKKDSYDTRGKCLLKHSIDLITRLQTILSDKQSGTDVRSYKLFDFDLET